jgi:hypothetical protein
VHVVLVPFDSVLSAKRPWSVSDAESPNCQRTSHFKPNFIKQFVFPRTMNGVVPHPKGFGPYHPNNLVVARLFNAAPGRSEIKKRSLNSLETLHDAAARLSGKVQSTACLDTCSLVLRLNALPREVNSKLYSTAGET